MSSHVFCVSCPHFYAEVYIPLFHLRVNKLRSIFCTDTGDLLARWSVRSYSDTSMARSSTQPSSLELRTTHVSYEVFSSDLCISYHQKCLLSGLVFRIRLDPKNTRTLFFSNLKTSIRSAR
jgi:hypothetical protein